MVQATDPSFLNPTSSSFTTSIVVLFLTSSLLYTIHKSNRQRRRTMVEIGSKTNTIENNNDIETKRLKQSSLPTSGQLERLFPIIKSQGKSCKVPLSDVTEKYKELNGSLPEADLRALLSKYDKNDDNELVNGELMKVCGELQIINLVREKEKNKSRKDFPDHLLLGLSITGMKEFIKSLPENAVKECNDSIPKDSDGKPKYPLNDNLNGYVNQFHIKKQSEKDKLAYCERERNNDSCHVGEATVFVSWFLQTPLVTLISALEEYLKQEKLPQDTKFWVCDFCIRQQLAKEDLKRLGDCVCAIGQTVLLMEPWENSQPLRRAYCIKEIYHTQVGYAKFDVVMSSTQQESFDKALIEDCSSIAKGISNINVREAKCLKKNEEKEILKDLKDTVGFEECNRLVSGMISHALVNRGLVNLEMLPAAKRKTSKLINNVARLLKDTGEYNKAMPLYEEALQGRRETLGNRHPSTLASINNMAGVLQRMGEYNKAMPLYEEALQGMRETLGDRHPNTLTMISNMTILLQEMGEYNKAMWLSRGWRKHLEIDTLTP